MGLSSVRSTLYRLARFLGDVNAVKRGRVGKRLARRAAGRMTGRGLGRLGTEPDPVKIIVDSPTATNSSPSSSRNA
jgi:hypothetical protein